jgi:hypothetical protein
VFGFTFVQAENASERKILLPSFGTKALSASAQRDCSGKRRLLRSTTAENQPGWNSSDHCCLLARDSSLNYCRVKRVHRRHPVGLGWIEQRKQLQLQSSILSLLCPDRGYQPEAQQKDTTYAAAPLRVRDRVSEAWVSEWQSHVDPLNALRTACAAFLKPSSVSLFAFAISRPVVLRCARCTASHGAMLMSLPRASPHTTHNT